jgi:hypothetical protein
MAVKCTIQLQSKRTHVTYKIEIDRSGRCTDQTRISPDKSETITASLELSYRTNITS